MDLVYSGSSQEGVADVDQMYQALEDERTNVEFGGVLPKLKVNTRSLTEDFHPFPAAAVPTESCGAGSSWAVEMPRAVMVCGEMTLAKVLPLSMNAAVERFPNRTGTYPL